MTNQINTAQKNNQQNKKSENGGSLSQDCPIAFEPLTCRLCYSERNHKSKEAPKIINKYGLKRQDNNSDADETVRSCKDIAVETDKSESSADNSPINTAQKIKDEIKSWENVCYEEDLLNENRDLQLGKLMTSLEAKKEEWRNEIDFLIKHKREIEVLYTRESVPTCNYIKEFLLEPIDIYIQELKLAVEIANG